MSDKTDLEKQPGPLALWGEMNVGRAAELKCVLLARLADGQPLHLDLGKVTELDGAGVQLLLLCRQRADARGIPFKVVAASAAVHDVLALLRLTGPLEEGQNHESAR